MKAWLIVMLLAAPALAAPSPVALEAPARSRLGAELRRELQASGFLVVERGEQWRVSVGEDDRVKVTSGDQPALDLWVDSRDRLARRRACLAVVELLRLERAPVAPEAAPVAPPPPKTVLVEAPALPARGRPWALGAATTVNLSSAVGPPTGHLQLLGQVALGPRWTGGVRAFWPLLGSQVLTPAQYVRMWTFGAAAGAHYALAPTRLQPYLGATAGARCTLTDTTSRELRQSRVVFTPSAALAVQGGVRYRVAAAQLFLELEAAQDWRLGGARTGLEEAAANARSAHASLGVLFDY